jgi:hypothetical protein
MSVMELSGIGVGQMVRVINKGPNPLTIKYNRIKYILEPEIEKVIPYEAAQVWFGDPRSAAEIRTIVTDDGMPQMIYPRRHEVRRLRAKYGNIEGIGDESEIQECPTIEMYNLDGERITTVLEDPHGNSVNQASVTVADNATTQSMIRQQQKQIELLMAELEKRGGLDDVEPDTDEASPLTIQTGDLPTDEGA